MEWRPQPETAEPFTAVQWIGREDGEDVAWIAAWRSWCDQDRQWQVATRYGTASGQRRTLQEAQRSAEDVVRVYGVGT